MRFILRCASVMSILLRGMVALAALGAVPTAPTRAAELRHVWNRSFSDEASYWLETTCVSRQGRATIIARSAGSMQNVDVAPDGSASTFALPLPPPEQGEIQRVYDCSWVDEGDLLLLVSTEKTPLAAQWLGPDLTVERWTPLVDRLPGSDEAQASSTLELRPGQFVTVGHGMLHAFALRFDRDGPGPKIFPWEEDGHERMLTDVAVTGEGFVACGIEAPRGADPHRDELQTVVAAFDSAGGVVATTRMRGGPCAVLTSKPDRIRLVHLAYGPPPILRAVTLDSTLTTIQSEDLISAFFGLLFEIDVVELGHTVVALNELVQHQTLEIFDRSIHTTVPIARRRTIPLDVVGSGSRIYVVSRTFGEAGARSGLRVDAYDLVDGESRIENDRAPSAAPH